MGGIILLIMTPSQARKHLIEVLPYFNFTSCPKAALKGLGAKDKKLVKNEYYKLHCQELGV